MLKRFSKMKRQDIWNDLTHDLTSDYELDFKQIQRFLKFIDNIQLENLSKFYNLDFKNISKKVKNSKSKKVKNSKSNKVKNSKSYKKKFNLNSKEFGYNIETLLKKDIIINKDKTIEPSSNIDWEEKYFNIKSD